MHQRLIATFNPGYHSYLYDSILSVYLTFTVKHHTTIFHNILFLFMAFMPKHWNSFSFHPVYYTSLFTDTFLLHLRKLIYRVYVGLLRPAANPPPLRSNMIVPLLVSHVFRHSFLNLYHLPYSMF